MYFLGTKAVDASPTPSADMKGASATANEYANFINYRPNPYPENQTAINDRSSLIQAAMNAAAAAGGGIVQLGPGLFQCNALVVPDRVWLRGFGSGITRLLGSETLLTDQPFISSQRFAEYAAIEDKETAPLFRYTGLPQQIAVTNLTIDGNGANGLSGTYDAVWDMTLQKPNEGKNNTGLALFSTGAFIDDVQVHWCSGHGVEVDRGSSTRLGLATPSDNTVMEIGSLKCRFNNGHGLKITAFPDGIIGDYTSESNGGTGLHTEGSSWKINAAHCYGDNRGVHTTNGSFFRLLELETCQQEGLFVEGAPININELVCFDCCLDGITDAYIRAKNGLYVDSLANTKLGRRDGGAQDGVSLFKFESGSQTSRVTGRADFRNTAVTNGVLFNSEVDAGQLIINANGWNANGANCSVYRKSSQSKANQIKLSYNAADTQAYTMVDGPVDPTDRLRIFRSGALSVAQINPGSGSVPGDFPSVSRAFEDIPF